MILHCKYQVPHPAKCQYPSIPTCYMVKVGRLGTLPGRGNWLVCHPCCSAQSAELELVHASHQHQQKSSLSPRYQEDGKRAAPEAGVTLSG